MRDHSVTQQRVTEVTKLQLQLETVALNVIANMWAHNAAGLSNN